MHQDSHGISRLYYLQKILQNGVLSEQAPEYWHPDTTSRSYTRTRLRWETLGGRREAFPRMERQSERNRKAERGAGNVFPSLSSQASMLQLWRD